MKLYTPKFKEQITQDEEGKEIKTLGFAKSLNLYENIDGKQYFYGEEIPDDCIEVKDYEGKEEEFVRVFKDRAIFEKNKEFRLVIENILDSYIPQEELLSWDMQYQEATSYKQNPKSDTPLLTSLCLARYKDLLMLGILADKVLEKSYQYKIISGTLIGQKQGIIDKIENATTMHELLELLKEKITLPSTLPLQKDS